MADKRETVCLCLLWNICCSITIVFINKWIYIHYNFPNVTLTCIHFIVTTLGLVLFRKIGIFHPKSLPFRHMFLLALTFCGFVVFTNLSLQHNTIGTYQIMKTLTTPCIIMIQSQFYEKNFSPAVIALLVPILCGVFLACYKDIKFNLIGIVYASTGVCVASIYQVMVGEKQSELQVSSIQLLYYQAPLSSLLLIIAIPFFDPIDAYHGVLDSWPLETLVMVLLSGVVAFAVNLSVFWIIGNTSPITYNMVGHLKFCLTLLGGFVIFDEQLNVAKAVGILLTLSGVTAYTYVKMREAKRAHLPNSIRLNT